ncbi:RidA family protein [Oricola sp.]|uniref:RidA family protein n=1 Tax=Oricola sp. TaxID=1979950 RepID=UPI0025CD5AB9|nr:RidA family protein [Oricola sp.]MCI5074479.1 RidA family protein [Oricola sp.]
MNAATRRECLNPPGMAFAGMSQGVRVGDTIHVSGQVALRDGGVIGIGDPEAQARQCLANIEAVLNLSGAGLADVVALRCYLVDAAHYPAYSAVKNALFPIDPPCGTAVIVKGLLLPELLIEVEAVATLPGG